jgi:hypothetical protein
MDVLIAIAALCQVSANQPYMARADKYQLNCQQEYVQCYFKADPTGTASADRQQKLLKDCVLERVVKATPCP